MKSFRSAENIFHGEMGRNAFVAAEEELRNHFVSKVLKGELLNDVGDFEKAFSFLKKYATTKEVLKWLHGKLDHYVEGVQQTWWLKVKL